MKLNVIAASAVLGTALLSPAISIAGEFEQAVKAATAEIDRAKDAGYEWRDSRKILKKATQAEKDGDHKKAMKLANQAKQQGIIAVAQAKLQADMWDKSINR